MLVLDTHVLLWWATGDLKQVSPKAMTLIKQELKAGEIVISSISAWEIAMLLGKGQLILSMELEEWLATIAQIDGVMFYAVDNEVALKSALLPGEFHKDPADRIIVATARKLGATLVTADEKIRAYPHVKTVW
jgi:PIN domain nuclease of toxin-antitoxin system